MKVFLSVVKTVVIICAMTVSVLRLIWYKYYEVLSAQTLATLNKASIVCAVVLALFALIWVICEKKKKSTEQENIK